MGKKQQKQQQPQQAGAKPAQEAKPEKKAKGHRQKGAGTVITAREPIVRDGIEVQSWQRIPTTLLNEYCQREKRPKPEYRDVHAPRGQSRCSVLVRDAKKADKDLTFTPVQSFDTVAAAKEHAALLALWHLQPTIPLERKLPEPYRTTWLSLLGEASGGAADEKKFSDAAKAAAKGKKAAAKEAKQKPAAQAAAEPEAESKQVSAAQAKPKKTPVIGLANVHTFASQAEERKAVTEERAVKSRKRNWREQYMRANKPMTVYMSPKMRRAVENVLGIRIAVPVASMGDSVSEQELRRALAQSIASSVEDRKAQDDLVDVLWPATCSLREMGFSSASVMGALASVKIPSPADADDDADAIGDDQLDDREDDEGYGSAASRRNDLLQTTARHFEARMLEHLMLHTQEEMLPEAFDPRGKGLEVISSSKKKAAAKHEDANLSAADRTLLRELQQYGIQDEDALLALAVAKQQQQLQQAGSESADAMRGALMLALWRALYAAEAGSLPATSDAGAGTDAGELADELEALDSIYPDLATVETLGETTRIRVVLPSSSDDSAVLDIFVCPDMSYPHLPPLALLRCSAASRRGCLGSVQRAIMKEAVAQAGQPIAFHLVSHIDANLTDYLDRAPPLPLDLQEHLLGLLSGGTSAAAVSAARGIDDGGDADADDRTDAETTISSASSVPGKQKTKRRRRWAEQGSSFWSPLPKGVLDSIPTPDRSSKQWAQMQRVRDSLPAANARAEFLSLLASHSVMLVSGETGCGKTTQIPQYILDDVYSSAEPGRSAKIVVCQPRRLAATGVARRVAEERLEEVGNTVGYMIRGESVTSSQTRLLFCTNGVLLRRLQDDADLVGVTHVIVDEVHERNLDSDFLMVLLRRLAQRRRNFKLILMSATLERDRFAAYFAQTIGTCPTIHIPGFTHPVQEFYLDDIREIFPSKGREVAAQDDDDDDDGDSEEAKQQHVFRFDERKLNYYYLTRCVLALLPGANNPLPPANGAILVFLPGVPEINRLQQSIQAELDRLRLSNTCWVLPLHGSLTAADQSRVFKVPNVGISKIVLATNVAETSITIPDITVVIDSCRVKQTEFDPATEMPMLVERLAARDSLQQRKGRAGRVQAGRCYRMLTRATHDALPSHTVPEILRVPLESVVLQLKAMGFNNTMALLGECIDPPTVDAVAAAERQLAALQALDDAGNLTTLGGHLAALPCPAKIGKMLLYACMLGCISPVLSIAAGLTIRSPFLTSSDPEKRKEIEAAKRELAHLGHGSCRSDHLLLARAYDRFVKSSDRRAACRQLCVSLDRMQELHVSRRQLADALVSVGFLPHQREADDLDSLFNSQHTNRRIIAASLCAGLYPNVIKVIRPPERYHEVAGGAIAKDAEAKHMKYFVREPEAKAEEKAADQDPWPLEAGLSQVWLHPGSINFSEASYNSRWLVYSEKVKTSKVYVRDTTEAPVYALLLFGGKLEAQYAQSTITVDGWIVFSAVGRIVALVNAIRSRMDGLLQQKLSDPSADIHDRQLMDVAIKLVTTDGLG